MRNRRGVALLRCVVSLDELKLEGDPTVGVAPVSRALEEPIRQIVINGGVEGAVIVMEDKKNKKAAFGFNASIAGLMITTECMIADKPEEDKKMGGGM